MSGSFSAGVASFAASSFSSAKAVRPPNSSAISGAKWSVMVATAVQALSN